MEGKIRRVSFGVASSILIFFGFYLFKFLGITTEEVLKFPFSFPNLFLSLRLESQLFQTFITLLLQTLKFIYPFLPLTLALSLLPIYGLKYEEDKLLSISILIPCLVSFLLVGISIPLIFLSIGLIGSSVFLTGLGEALPQELKKWEFYRTGTHSIGKAFLIINILLTCSLFLTVFINLETYETLYKNQTQEAVMKITPTLTSNLTLEEVKTQLPPEQRNKLETLPEEEQEKLLNKIKNEYSKKRGEAEQLLKRKIEQMLNSKMMVSFIDLILFSMAILIFGILELLRNLFLTPLAGVVTSIASRL